MQRTRPFPITRRDLCAGSAGAAALALLGRLAPAAAAAPGELAEVAPGVYVHQGVHALFNPDNGGNISNAGVIVGKEAVAIVDTGGSAKVGGALKASVTKITDKPIKYVINTHMHPDHVFGNAAFEGPDTVFAGHHKLARGLAARAERYVGLNRELLGEVAFEGTRIILPKIEVEDRMELDLGGRKVVLEAQRTAHTDNDLIVRDVETDTLFLGDLLFSEHIPTLDGSIRGWLALMETLAAAPAARVVPGHGPAAMAWPEAVRPQQHYFQTVAADVRRMLKEGKSLSEATESAATSEKSAWLLFDDYHKRNVSAAYAELEWEE